MLVLAVLATLGVSSGVGTASASAYSTLQVQQGEVDGMFDLAGGFGPYQDPTTEYMGVEFAQMLQGSGSPGSAWDAQLSSLVSAGPDTWTELDDAMLQNFVESGLTTIDPSTVGLNGAGDLSAADLLPAELAVPGLGDGAAVATGVIALGSSLFAVVNGPPVTYPAAPLQAVDLCSNSTQVVTLSAPCVVEGSALSSNGLWPCVGGMVSDSGDFGPSWWGNDTNLCPSSGEDFGVPLADPTQVTFVAMQERGGSWYGAGFTDATCENTDPGGSGGWTLGSLPSPYQLIVNDASGCTDSNGDVVAGAHVGAYVEPASDFQMVGPVAGGSPSGDKVTTVPWQSPLPAGSTVLSTVQQTASSSSPAGSLEGTLEGTLNGLTPSLVDVPSCDGDFYPESSSTCVGQVGSLDVHLVERAMSDLTCTSDSFCNTVGDPVGTVEGMSSADAGSYVEAGGAAVPAGSTVYVFVEGGTNQPLGGGLTMPDCSGLTVPACETAVSEGGFTSSPEVTWEDGSETGTAVGNVIATTPAPSTVETDPTTTVKVDGSGLVIPAPTSDELYTQYETDLQTAGFPNDVDTVLDVNELDPWLVANAVVQVQPAPGTVWSPLDAPTVQLTSNPATMPAGTPGTAPGSGGSGAIPTTPDPFQGPLVDPDGFEFPSIPTPCNVFPFGVPCWLFGQLAQFSATSQAPNFSFNLGSAGGTMHIDLANVDGFDMGTAMDYVRPVFAAMSFVGIVLWLAGKVPGSGGGGGSRDFPPMADSEGGDLSEWNV